MGSNSNARVELGLFQKFAQGRKDLASNWRPNLFPSRIRDCNDSTPFLYHVRYTVHLFGYFFQKGGILLQEDPTTTITITVSTIVGHSS